MVPFTLRQLSYFSSVAKHGGIAQAARGLNVAQPSVAQALDKLEDLTGLTLFERHHARGVTLTSVGRSFLTEAEALMAQADRVWREVAALKAEESGEIRFGCFLTLAAFYLPGLIRMHRTRYPGVLIKAEELSLDEIARGLRQGDLDAALTYDIAPHLGGIDAVRLLAIPPRVLLPASHPKAGRRSIAVRELAEEPYVMFDAAGSREYFERLLSELGVAPRVSYATSSLEGVRSAVGQGFGFSIVAVSPQFTNTYDNQSVVAIPISDPIPALNVVLAMRRGVHSHTMLRNLVLATRDYFGMLEQRKPAPL